MLLSLPWHKLSLAIIIDLNINFISMAIMELLVNLSILIVPLIVLATKHVRTPNNERFHELKIYMCCYDSNKNKAYFI